MVPRPSTRNRGLFLRATTIFLRWCATGNSQTPRGHHLKWWSWFYGHQHQWDGPRRYPGKYLYAIADTTVGIIWCFRNNSTLKLNNSDTGIDGRVKLYVLAAIENSINRRKTEVTSRSNNLSQQLTRKPRRKWGMCD